MKMSLEQLQEIRERRLDKQRKEVQNCKDRMVAAEQTLEQCRQNLVNFRQWRLDHQEDMFQGLQGQACSPQAMFEYRAKLEKLTEEEQQLHVVIKQAEDDLKATQQQFAQASKIATELALKNEKTKEIIEIQDKAERELAKAKDD